MSFPIGPQFKLNLEQQRKRAKDLRRAHREGNIEAAVRIIRRLPRARNLSPAEELGSALTLSEAQFVIAREAGFSSWPSMRKHIEQSMHAEPDNEVIINAAFAGNDDAVRTVLDRQPSAMHQSIHVAAALADAEAVFALLDADPSLADLRGGRRAWTPLLYLCCSKYRRSEADASEARLAIVRRLLDLGADLNAPGKEPGLTSANVTLFDEYEWRPIEGAAGRLASPELVQLLLEAGANLEQTSTVLTQAVSGGNSKVLQLLLDALPSAIWWQVIWALKASVALQRTDMARLLSAHGEPTVRERALIDAIEFGRDLELIEVLLGQDDSHPGTHSVRRNAYRAALRFGHHAALDLLRRRGIDDSVVTDVDRVIGACITGNPAELDRLLAQSPNLKSAFVENDHRMVAWALRNHRYLAVPLLLRASLDPNVSDKDGETPLHLAVHANSMEVVTALLDSGAKTDARNFDAETPLDVAVADNDGEARKAIVKKLLDAGARPAPDNTTLDREDAALLFERAADAVVFGDLEKLRTMLDEEPPLVHARSPRPHRATLLHYCGANGVEDPRQRTPSNAPAITQLLLERGADADAICNLYGGGATTMGLLLTSIHPIKAGLRMALTETLLKFGATFDGARGAEGIVGAAALGRLDLVRSFSNSTTTQMQSAFMWACEFGRTSIVEFLLDKGVDLGSQKENGQTGLHLAALAGHLDTVKLLLKRKAPLEVKNAWGGTVLGNVLWAVINWDPHVNYVPIIETLVEAGARIDPEYLPWWVQQNVPSSEAKARIEKILRNPL